MNSRYSVLLIVLFLIGCTKPPEIIPDEITDFTYDQLKIDFNSCSGKGIMISKGDRPWKLNYSFITQNDSSFIQFKDVLGRRILFVQALPIKITLWDMQKNLQYNYERGISIPILDLVDSYDIAQILWGEVPLRFSAHTSESGFEKDSNLVNFELSASNLGMVLDKVIFNIDSANTVIEFKIFERDYGKSNIELLKGIPKQVPYN